MRAGRDPETNAYRLIHGEADGWDDLYVDRIGDFLLMQSPRPLTGPQIDAAKEWKNKLNLNGVYYKQLNRGTGEYEEKRLPATCNGSRSPDTFEVRENGAIFRLA
ncbi:MAG: hypothetical protein CM1200mP29_14010 [Verrucomicrobiota bacterium]|nr:MAG: hypothetical protein CM1200mP29_14010 [Verrucomicrobiota bacterium]